MKITEYPHLELSQAEFDAICAVDPVILAYKDKIDEKENSFEGFAAYDAARRIELEDIYRQEAEHKAALRILSGEKGTVRGKIAVNIMHERRSKQVIAQTKKRIEAREKQIFLGETNKRLRTLGKTIRMPRGSRTRACDITVRAI